VFNYSGDFHFLWDEITVPVKYGSDYRLAREVFKQIADEITGEYAIAARDGWKEMVQKYLIEDARVDPMIFLVANDNWMEFAIRYVVDYKKRRITKDLFYTRILEEIDKTDGRIAIASTTIHIVETPRLDVRLTGAAGNSRSD
jgi:small-conductance mechanosensitive channel